MEFCPNCGMRLIVTQDESEQQDKVLICPKCNYSKLIETEETALQNMNRHQDEIITVIGEEEAKLRTMPTTKIECPECGNLEAYWWIVQTRGADESATQFFRCSKCNHTWREMT